MPIQYNQSAKYNGSRKMVSEQMFRAYMKHPDCDKKRITICSESRKLSKKA